MKFYKFVHSVHNKIIIKTIMIILKKHFKIQVVK